MLETRIATTAARQQGYMTRATLLALGLGSRGIDYRVQAGRLILVHRGVYRLAGVPDTPLGRAAAAVLACGAGAALSHDSAAVLWKLRRHWPEVPEVTVTGFRERPGIVVHRSKTLGSADVRTYERIRVTSPARTILDTAPRLDDNQLARSLSDSSSAGHLHLGALNRLLSRSFGVPGAARLARLLGDHAPTRSELEDAFKRFLKHHSLPRPRINTHVAGYEVDALFELERVIVELDGYRYHHDPGAFERDRKRDRVLAAAGFQTVRLTWWGMTREAAEEAELLRTLLAARRLDQASAVTSRARAE